ncbi:hypothetical protein [Streptomyces antioxidans]|uniref:hypothetical protein n=1 Tax=Streptomyces antioxidans TaxID=1507734 RepID=UPI001F0AA0EE|nr:hypothetical protein [Streptomyces antioxidans]
MVRSRSSAIRSSAIRSSAVREVPTQDFRRRENGPGELARGELLALPPQGNSVGIG